MTLYAMYRGDEFIDVGTAYQLAERHNCKVESILFKASKTYHRRTGEKAVKVYRIEEDEETDEAPLNPHRKIASDEE